MIGGQIAYEAFADALGVPPRWQSIGEAEQRAWEAAAREVLRTATFKIWDTERRVWLEEHFPKSER